MQSATSRIGIGATRWFPDASRGGREVGPTFSVILLTLAIFFVFAGDGLRGYFAPDEMMNLFHAWSPPLRELAHHERPVGDLLYRAMFGAFDLDPLPYRILSFLLLLANLGLLYRFCLLASGSRAVGGLALVVGAYHAHLADFYYTSSCIFDLLCFLFYFLALTYYMTIRGSGRRLTWRQTGITLLLYVAALGSKEMAVSLPVLIAAYEFVYGKSVLRVPFLWISVPLTAAYAYIKTRGLAQIPDYHPAITPHVFFEGWRHYLGDLFYRAIGFNDFKIVVLWLVLLGVAFAFRRRDLIFAVCLMTIGALPIIFIAPRGLFALYVTLPGWYLYVSACLISATPSRARVPLFAAVALFLAAAHAHEKRAGKEWVAGAFQQTRPMIEQLGARFPTMPHSGRLLFLSDPCPPNDYIVYFICALRYHDRDIHVDRAKDNPALLDRGAWSRYDRVFTWGANGLAVVRRELPPVH